MAQEGVAGEKYRRQVYKDIRWLGRGNAGVAVVDDGSALFYNPAGLGRNQKYDFQFINPVLGISASTITNISAASSLGGGGSSISQKFSPFLGEPLAVDGGSFPNLAVPNFAFGGFYLLDSRIEYRNPVSPEINIEERDDMGVIGGMGFEVFEGLSLGVSLRWAKRRTIYQGITGSSLISLTTNSLAGFSILGTGWAVNAGAQYRLMLSESQSFSLGLAIEDLGNTVYRSSLGSSKSPGMQIMAVNVGVAYELVTSLIDIKFLFDARNLGDGDYYSTGKLLHQGVEVSLLGFDIRGGYYQGYWSAGLSFRQIPFLRIDFSSYAEELDRSLGIRENRMYVMSLSLGTSLETLKRKKQKFTLDDL